MTGIELHYRRPVDPPINDHPAIARQHDLYPPGCRRSHRDVIVGLQAPAPSTAGPTTLAPTVALALLFGEYMQRACHGRYDAKARNLRRSLRAAAAFADAVEWRNPQARHALIEVCPPPRSCTTLWCAIPPGADHCLSDGKGGSPVAALRCSYYVRSDD